MASTVPAGVTGTLEVHVNRERPNRIELPSTFETHGDFVIHIINDGKPVHLHVNHDDDLAAGLAMETGNHFIPRENVFTLPVAVDPDARPFHGKLRMSVGYGSETQYVEIRVGIPDTPQQVTVDEQLAQPQARPPPRVPITEFVGTGGLLAFLIVAGIAILAGAVLIASLTTSLVGVVVIVLALVLATAAYLLVDSD